MKDPKLLLFTCLLVVSLTASRPIHYKSPDCRNFEFKTDLSKNPGSDFFTLTITANGGRSPYHYLLLDGKNSLISKDFTKSHFTGLSQGRYRCIVTDADDCTKEQFIEVK
jgi:hypothetical protein